MINTTDTIVAASSPPGRSLRGLVRISGDRTAEVLNALGLDWSEPRRLAPGRAQLGAPAHVPVMVVRWHAPDSYTGADLAEIQLPGNPALLERLIARIIETGARLAEPGEFTCRAFLAGKLDLPQAEGIAATIAAVSDGQLFAAQLLRQGRLGSFAAELVDELADALALVEAGIDFTDQEDVVSISPGDLDRRLEQVDRQLLDLLSHSRAWGALEALPHVVLAGAPSTGKSTLFNALLRRHRAVISPMPGTTRDILTEPLALRDDQGREVEIMLVDIAGLGEPTSVLDRRIQAQARNALEQAELILHVDDGRGSSLTLPRAAVPVLRVHSKSDRTPPPPTCDISVCALTGAGLGDLRRAIVAAVGDRAVGVSAQMLALQPRHAAALRAAGEHLTTARDLLEAQRDAEIIDHVELVAQAVRSALDDLAGLGGRMTPDDVIGRVFARFCVGK